MSTVDASYLQWNSGFLNLQGKMNWLLDNVEFDIWKVKLQWRKCKANNLWFKKAWLKTRSNPT